jgi:uncharacterized repeat protein (TIGR01451 family)
LYLFGVNFIKTISNIRRMRKIFTFLLLSISVSVSALNSTHFTINRITAPYFIVDGNAPATLNKAYVGFEIRNNSNSAVTYSGLKFQVLSISTSVAGQNFALVAPVNGLANIGTLAPGQSKTCYFYVSYPAAVAPQGTFNIQLSDNTAGVKTQSFVVANRSSISANAGGTATQSFTNQDLIGGLIYDDVTYVVGNVQNGDESDFQVAVSPQFDPTRITLLGTEVLSSAVPGINVGATDSLYFITGNGTNGASVTVRWIFRITGVNFTTYLLPCAGATSGSSNYKYALNTTLGQGSPVTISESANPLTITKTSDQVIYGTNKTATFTITITNPGLYGITIDRITDEIPAGFVFQAMHGTSQVTSINSTAVPVAGATGNIVFEGGVVSGPNSSYYIAAGQSIIVRYTATTPAVTTSNLVTSAKGYVAETEIGTALNTVSVSATLPSTLLSFNAGWNGNTQIRTDWRIINETTGDCFELERSTGTSVFTTIGKIASTGITGIAQQYSFVDSFPAMDNNRYRLKMIGRDNGVKYGPVVLVSRRDEGWDLVKLFPAPFSNEFNIQLISGKKISLHLELTDAMGNIVNITNLQCPAGSSTTLLSGLGHLAPGLYTLRVSDGARVVQQKLIRQ